MEHTRVPYAMQNMIKGLQSDLREAEKLGDIDPVGLAAKYCHIFVNIHPFLNGNGRLCRLILNSILLKYSGTLACIGHMEDDRDEYLRIASSASYREQNSRNLDGIPDDLKPQYFTELATFTLLHARGSLRKFTDCQRIEC
uniref:Fido domain-containing protein n=1 Tax=Bionectria ochroleuca TaxID=29856 RepID=A0A8H7NCS3_BIOOC